MLKAMLSLPPITFQSFTHGTWTEMASLWIEPGTHMAESISEFFFLWL